MQFKQNIIKKVLMLYLRLSGMQYGGWVGAPLVLLLVLPPALPLGSRHVVSVRREEGEEVVKVGEGSKEVNVKDLISFPLEAIPRQPRTEGKST